MNRFIYFLFGIFLATNLLAKPLVSIEGNYFCKGNDPTMIPADYTGQIDIKKVNSAYILNEGALTNASFTYKQVALREGNILSMAYQPTNDPNTFGVESMIISNDAKTLTGTFVYYAAHKKAGHEVCKRIEK